MVRSCSTLSLNTWLVSLNFLYFDPCVRLYNWALEIFCLNFLKCGIYIMILHHRLWDCASPTRWFPVSHYNSIVLHKRSEVHHSAFYVSWHCRDGQWQIYLTVSWGVHLRFWSSHTALYLHINMLVYQLLYLPLKSATERIRKLTWN